MTPYKFITGVGAKLPGEPGEYKRVEDAPAKRKPKPADLRETFAELWDRVGPWWVAMQVEYRFHPVRRWRFDVAFPAQHVAVELDGGTWSGGRHTRGAGYQKDAEKLNAAAALGWRVLRYTATDLKQRPVQVVEEVRALLEQGR